MLQILRKKAQSTFIQIIVVIIVLVFVFWGVGTNMLGNREGAIVVNGEEISFQQYQQAYDAAYQRLSDQFGGNVPKGLAETFGIKQQVIRQLIQTSLLRQGAVEMGIVVSDQDIQNVIKNMVQFQENGEFDMERYKSILTANRMAPTKFEQSLHFDKLSEIGALYIGNFAAITTDYEVQDIYGQINEKIALKYVKLSPDTFVERVEINDEQLLSWFETVKDNYKTAPESKLNYLTFTFEDIGKKVQIDNEKIEDYYQNNIAKYQEPEQRHARHILFKASAEDSDEIHKAQSAKAVEIRNLAQNGANFVDLAKQHSEGPSKDSGGDLGFFASGSMVPAFNTAVFALQPGKISEVIKTQFGYHIILLEEIKPATTKPLDTVTAEITKTIQRQEAESLAFQVANHAYEGIISAGSLARYTEQNPDLHVLETDFFNSDNGPKDLQQDPQFLNKAFELNKGELSSLIKGQSGYAILYKVDIKEPELPSFESIKTTLEIDYKKSRSKELTKTAATELLASIKDGKDLESASQESGYVVKESGLLSQNGSEQQSDFPTSLTKDAFLLSASSATPDEPGQDGGDYYVYSLLSRQTPDLPTDSKELAKYRENLLNFTQQQILSAWLQHMEMNSEITQNQSL